jgi:hypothetical protein
MNDTEIPSVRYIAPTNPENRGESADVLLYPVIGKKVVEYAKTNGLRQDRFFENETDELDDQAYARQLAFEYYLNSCNSLINSSPDSRDLWADRVTTSSAELFGFPEMTSLTTLVSADLDDFEAMQHNPDVDQDALDLVLSTYGAALPEGTTRQEGAERLTDDEKNGIKLMKTVLQNRYGDALSIAEKTGQTKFTADDLADIFEQTYKALAATDETWNRWENVRDGTNMQVNGKDRNTRIPKQRKLATLVEVNNSVGHELYGHAMRANNAYKTNDERLRKGYPGYLTIDEGIAVTFAAATSGLIKDEVYDHYVDVGLTGGLLGDRPMKRGEMYKLDIARRTVRAQAEGKTIDPEEIRQSTSLYVDRLFRGSPGNDVGVKQGIYTGDSMYFIGLKKITNFINQACRSGKTPDQVYDYIMQGRFDPTDEVQVKRLEAYANSL